MDNNNILMTPKIKDQINKCNIILMGVTGGPASGKSKFVEKVILNLESFGVNRSDISVISMSSYYKILQGGSYNNALDGNYNVDHPESFNDEKIFYDLSCLKQGKSVTVATYDFVNFKNYTDRDVTIRPGKIVIFEGILAFYFQQIRDLFDVKLFIDSESDVRLSRIVTRDMNDRNRPINQIITNYTKFVKMSFESFCLPTKKYADIIIPRGIDNNIAIQVVAKHVWNLI